jgi:hypothetical protein
MWSFVNDLVHRGGARALANGSSTRISLLWLGFGVLALGFLCTGAIEWLTGKRDRAALFAAAKSWKSYAGAALALALAWACLFVYSTLSVAYVDHQTLVAAATNNCATKVKDKPQAPPPVDGRSHVKPPPKVETHIIQSGVGNTANPGVITAPVTQGDCGVVQNGGSNNNASPVCGPPPLLLTIASVNVGTEGTEFTEKPGFIKTEITIVPNQQVVAPFIIALEFDNPVTEIGHTVRGVAAQMLGGAFRVGTNARETVLTNLSPSHPLVVVVFSRLPVKLMAVPHIEY